MPGARASEGESRMQWYYAKRGEKHGPMEDAEFRRLIQQGTIIPQDLVWNSSMSDRWAPASSIAGLFNAATVPATAGAPAPARPGVLTHNRDLMRLARESLRGRWGFGVGVSLLYMAISLGCSFLPVLGSLASLLITGPMIVGFTLVFLNVARRQAAEVGQLFYGFQRFGTALGAYLLMALFILLWSLLLVIPGIIAAYSYGMTYFVIADDPAAGPLAALRRSKEMMRGRKWKLFCLSWRFFGWALLSVLTFGIGLFWLWPYMQTAMAHFYDDVRPRD